MLFRALMFVLLMDVATASAAAETASPARQFITGVDMNYALLMQSKGRTWSVDGRSDDPFGMFAKAGCDQIRVRLWTGDTGVNGLIYAIETARRARAVGLKAYLVIFLSEDWADYVKQPAPAMWKALTLDEKCKAIEAYSQRVTRRFTEAGIDIDTFEIGNEIDFGLCGEFEEEWPKRVNIDYMRQNIWPRVAPMLLAAQRGVRSVRPGAKFVIHLTQWNNDAYCIAYWHFMIDQGVAVDFAGLSYFPTSVEKPEERSLAHFGEQLKKYHDALDRPILVCEFAYPCRERFDGQFADWNKPADGYPLTVEGQARWVKDFLSTIRGDPKLAGAFYWSPEWYDPGMWEAFALFEHGAARAAMKSFANSP